MVIDAHFLIKTTIDHCARGENKEIYEIQTLV